MNYGVRVKFTLFAVVAVLMMLVVHNTMVNRVGGQTQTYRADFISVSGLRPGDDVRAAGVRVGRVESIELTDEHAARVEFTLGEGQTITDTTTISVRYQNLLGQRYLSLMPGDEPGGEVDAERVIGTAQTDPGFDLTALLNGFEPLFDTLEPEAVNQLAGSLISVLQGEGGTVASLLEQTAVLTRDLAAKDDLIAAVLTNLTPVLQNFTAQKPQFTATVDQLTALMAGLAAERDTLTGSIDGASALAQAAASLSQQLRPDLDTTVASLRGVVETLVGHQDSLDTLFAKGPAGFAAFTHPTNTGTWLQMYMCVISVEAVPGAKVPIGGPEGPFSEVCS